jgi:hypothetical protein
LAAIIRSFVSAEIDKLERRLAATFKYCGTYESGREYRPGNFVTDNGSIWHCDKPTTTRPGDGDCWTLAVKRGRDARVST